MDIYEFILQAIEARIMLRLIALASKLADRL